MDYTTMKDNQGNQQLTYEDYENRLEGLFSHSMIYYGEYRRQFGYNRYNNACVWCGRLLPNNQINCASAGYGICEPHRRNRKDGRDWWTSHQDGNPLFDKFWNT